MTLFVSPDVNFCVICVKIMRLIEYCFENSTYVTILYCLN